MLTRTVAFLGVATVLLGGGAVAAAGGNPGRTRPGGAVVTEIEIPVPGQAAVVAYLVRPVTPAPHRSRAGALFLHWFEPPGSTQNRTEFLAEAVDLANRGAVAVLPQLTFPWDGDPAGDATDRTKITAQLAAVESAYASLVNQPDVDPHRTAVIGHDYGSMFGALLAERQPLVRAAVFMAGDATWANWFDTYWLDLPDERKAAYRAVFAGLDPVDNVSRLGDHLYFQWAGRDQFVTPAVRAAFSAANPRAKVSLYDRADHFLTQPAKDDREAWLTTQLSL
ncbi:alpha/beta hydrolase family protein [Hamadaea tsunoensis]|uniref:alpha/beta hydrolase family protein n=1 Tax=Hamadaea tsunoensis TaxID=53368 RepID=UPI0003F4EAFF|nr:dienelactone hydrolase family protein [Hamadaea tsunoensis]